MALEIKLQMEHCMPVIHRVRVDFNIPGQSKREEKIPPTKTIMYMYLQCQNRPNMSMLTAQSELYL